MSILFGIIGIIIGMTSIIVFNKIKSIKKQPLTKEQKEQMERTKKHFQSLMTYGMNTAVGGNNE